MRLVWTVVVVNGRTASALLTTTPVESILLKAPQIFWIAGFFYTALVWERLSDQASSMQQRTANKKHYERLSFKVNMLNVFLLFVILPLYIYGNFENSYIAVYAPQPGDRARREKSATERGGGAIPQPGDCKASPARGGVRGVSPRQPDTARFCHRRAVALGEENELAAAHRRTTPKSRRSRGAPNKRRSHGTQTIIARTERLQPKLARGANNYRSHGQPDDLLLLRSLRSRLCLPPSPAPPPLPRRAGTWTTF
jgi:hypothetical protein